MIQVPRRAAERFRAAVRRCVNGRPRGFAPSIVLTQTPKLLTMSAAFGEVILSSSACRLPRQPTSGSCSRSRRLEAIARADGEMMTIDVSSRARSPPCLEEGGRRDRQASDAMGSDPGESATMPSVRMRSLDADFRAALHECCKSASREAVRFALSKILLCGKEGSVVGSDGRQLLLWSGFDLPFRERSAHSRDSILRNE